MYDEDVTASDEVGRTTQKLSALCTAGGIDEWFQITYKGRKSGMLHLKGNFTAASAAKQGMAAATMGVQNTMAAFGNMYAAPMQPMQPAMPMGTYPMGA